MKHPRLPLWLTLAVVGGMCLHTAWFKWTPPYQVVTRAARTIVQGGNPYLPQPDLDFFKYSPLAGLLMLPFSFLPDKLGTLLLLLLQSGLFLWAISRWFRAVGFPLGSSVKMQWVAIFSVFFDYALAIQNAQWNVGIFALMILGAAQYADGRYGRAGWILSLGTNLKVYPFTLGLCLLTGMKKRFWASFLGGFAVWLFAPSLLVGVRRNFELLRQWYELMTWDVTRDLDPMLDVATFAALHFGVDESFRTPMALLAGTLTGATTLYLFRTGKDRIVHRFLLPVNGLYIVLFSYLSESATSVLATGGILLIGIEAVTRKTHRRRYLLLWFVSLLLIPCFYSDIVGHDLGVWAREFHLKTVGYVYTTAVVGWLLLKHYRRQQAREARPLGKAQTTPS